MGNTPKIRFQGFDDAWEQRKVGELVKEHNAGIYISKESYGEGTNVIGVGNIYDSDIFDGEIYRLGPVDDDNFLLQEGDLIYGESSLVLEGIARTVCVGKNGVGSAFAWHTRRVKLDQDIVDSHFATLELNYHPVVRKYLMSVATQTALTGMTTDGYFSALLFLPSLDEQKQISEVFKNIDNLITLQQRKCDEMKEFKKSMLQKMFPKNDEDKPEVRFEGFTDAWEQRKVSEVAHKTFGGGTPKTSVDEYWNGKIPWIQSSNLSEHELFDVDIQKSITDVGLQKSAAQLVPADSIAVVSHVGVGKLVFMPFEYTTSQDFISLSELKSNPIFTCYALYKRMQEDLHIVQGSAIKGITKEDLLSKIISVPSLAEQEKIGTALKNLDTLITLQQRKCDELKEYKKFMLQNMFV